MSSLVTNPKIAELYRGVPTEMVERLQQFRKKYPYKSAIIRGVTWRYIDTGEGRQVVLALSGAGCIAELSWRTTERLARYYRVISPDYPAIDTNSDLAGGIAGILDREGIQQAHVIGGSYGGLVAQIFVRHQPDRTKNLILSHTILPDPENARSISKMIPWLRLVPAPVLRAAFKRMMRKLIPNKDNPDVALMNAHFAEIVDYHLSKPQLISLMSRTVDASEGYIFTPDDLNDWPGRILLILSEDDPATPEPARQELAAMYPRAQVCLFSGGGHVTSVVQQDEYVRAIEEFIGS
jgi:pimeloyl-ACP methyl ester carboxylesterase